MARKPQPSRTGTPYKAEFRERNLTVKLLYRCRCSRRICYGRQTLAKHPATYKRGPRKCGSCGALLIVDWNRTLLREVRKDICHCGAVDYPHRAGYCAKVKERNGG